MKQESIKRRRNSLTFFIIDSYPSYLCGWVHKDICKRLEKFSSDVVDGLSPRLMLLMPPRHGKSFIVSERFPVWHLGRNPSHQILLASYGQFLSDSFSKRARNLAREPITEETFEELMLDPEKQSVQVWETTQGGAYRSVGVGGGATGTGCNILIIDDPIKNAMEASSKTKRQNDWEWYTTTGYTRLAPGGGICIIQTRWHDDDLAGRLINAMNCGDGDDWEIAVYPAIAEADEEHRKAGDALHPDRYNITKLNRIKRAIGTRAWNSLYQQKPNSDEGNLFKSEWWVYYTTTPTRFERIIQSWDLNFKEGESNDFVVGTVWGKLGADYYLLDLVRGQWDFIRTVEEIKKLSFKWIFAKPILIEDKANGPAVISSLKSKISGIIGVTPMGSKESRAAIVTPICQAKNVHLPESAPWKNDFIDEATNFPRGMHDDQVDTMTQAIIHLEQQGKLAVFEDLPKLFGDPQEYFEGNWNSDEEQKGIYIGVKWGLASPNNHVFYAIDSSGKTTGYRLVEATNPSQILTALKSFALSLTKGVLQATVLFDGSGFGETMARIISEDYAVDWHIEPVKMSNTDIDSMISFLKESINQGKLKLRPWSILFDQMVSFKCEETEKGTIIYGAPEGMGDNAVFALILAHEAWRKYSGDVGIAVINEIDKINAKIYYGSGGIDDFD